MNQKTAAFIAALLLIGYAVYGQLFPSKYNDTELIVFIDRTDSFALTPNSRVIKDYFNLSKEKWKGAHCIITTISELTTNKEFRIDLEGASWLLSNELERNKKIENFYKEVDAAFNEINKVPIGKSSSIIYTPLARKLNALRDAEAGTIEVFVFSDMLEHSNQLSFYDPKTIKLMQTNPNQVIDQLQKQCPLKSISFTIHLYYLPKNTLEDQKFEIISNFYKNMLENKGATLIINN